jgi:hypothetical protein
MHYSKMATTGDLFILIFITPNTHSPPLHPVALFRPSSAGNASLPDSLSFERGCVNNFFFTLVKNNHIASIIKVT